MNTKQILVSKIKPNPKNPKKHDIERITDSVKEFGYIEPIVVDENDVILAGHGRLKALKELKQEKVDVIVKKGLTEKQKEKYLLLSNKLVERGGWDMELLMERDIDELLEAGFSEQELGGYWDSLLEIEDDGFNLERAITEIDKPITDEGDLWQLGKHRLLVGDSTKKEDIERLMGGEKTGMIFTDPPYNIGIDYGKGITPSIKYRKNFPDLKYKGFKDNKKVGEYKEFLSKTIENVMSVAKKDFHIFYWCDQNYIWLLQQLFIDYGIHLRRVNIWVKNNFNVTPQIAFNKVYEPCVYGTVGKPYLNPDLRNLSEILNKEVDPGVATIDDILNIIDVWLVKRDSVQDYEHPTQKPIALNEKPMKRCTIVNDIVLDVFGGSGSTLIAAEQIKRRAYLIEIDPVFASVILNRYEKFTNIKPKKIK